MRISDWSSDVCSSDLIVQRAHADEGDRRAGAGVMAPQRYPAAGAAHDLLSLAAAGRRVDGVRLAAKQFDTGGLDHRVERERAAGLPLGPAAVAAMHHTRQRGEAVAHGAERSPRTVR